MAIYNYSDKRAIFKLYGSEAKKLQRPDIILDE